MIVDQNGNRVCQNIQREDEGWGVTVWFGGINGFTTTVRRNVYATRAQARKGDISDDIGQRGRIG